MDCTPHRLDPSLTVVADLLEHLYRVYNRREYVHPDPLEFLYPYPDPREREIVALIASSLAYGRVARILTSVAEVLERMQTSPRSFVKRTSVGEMCRTFDGFVHRFATGYDLAMLLAGTGRVLDRYGSLHRLFGSGLSPGDDSVLPALTAFVRTLSEGCPACPGHLLPRPERGSACKRFHLFLRWMVRRDAVDPGGWEDVPPALLIVPLDVHMHRIGRRLGLTRRKVADLRTARELTDGFRRLAPTDPVRYDFSLSRLGIRSDLNVDSLLESDPAPGERPHRAGRQ
jgi:uncharacterized protein (TIGR02757 family)